MGEDPFLDLNEKGEAPTAVKGAEMSWRVNNWRLCGNSKPEWPQFSLRIKANKTTGGHNGTWRGRLLHGLQMMYGANLQNENTWSRIHTVVFFMSLLSVVTLISNNSVALTRPACVVFF